MNKGVPPLHGGGPSPEAESIASAADAASVPHAMPSAVDALAEFARHLDKAAVEGSRAIGPLFGSGLMTAAKAAHAYAEQLEALRDGDPSRGGRS